jgi:SAM-dependent methyltransferase
MTTYPASFRADVRAAQDARDLDGSWCLWWTRTLIELAPKEIARFVGRSVGDGGPLRIAYVGCGNGYLALELARAGHTVTGIDPSDGVDRRGATNLRGGRP